MRVVTVPAGIRLPDGVRVLNGQNQNSTQSSARPSSRGSVEADSTAAESTSDNSSDNSRGPTSEQPQQEPPNVKLKSYRARNILDMLATLFLLLYFNM